MENLFMVVHVQIMKDGTHASTMAEYTDIGSARSAYYSNLASDSISEALASFSCTILNYHCGQEKVEYYDVVTPNESEE